jgi:SSS family solute:Na+ symporter
MNLTLTGILIYVLVTLAIGIGVSRRSRTEADYLLAGRRLNLGLASFMVFATWFGAEACIGAAGKVYAEGLGGSIADPFAYTICLLLMGFVFAVPLWRRGLTTLADLFRQRYSPGVERLAVLLMVPTSVIWAAAQVRALGQVISATSTFDVELAIAIAAGVVVVYTVYGGLFANAVTDLVQGIALMIGLIVLLVVILQVSGGSEVFSRIEPDRLQFTGGPDASFLTQLEKWAIPVIGSALAQELVAIMLGSRSAQTARRAALLGGGIYFLFGLIPVAIGLIALPLLPNLAEPEQLLPRLAQAHLSTLPFILFIGAMTAAILSTVSAALLAAAALTEHNLVVPLAPALTPLAKVRIARTAVALFGLIAYLLALHAGGVYELVEQASAFGSAGIFTIGVLGLFSRIGGPRAAYGALFAGVGTWLLGNHVWMLSTPYLASLATAVSVYLLLALTESRHSAVMATS